MKDQLRAAVEKGEVDKLRTLLRGSEGPSELTPLLQLACACTKTGVSRVEIVELLLEKGADPSEIGDDGSALWLAVAKGTSAVVSTLLEKATPKQRVAAARTLLTTEREKGKWAPEVREVAGIGLEKAPKAWLEQIVCILHGDAASICGDHAHLRPVQDGEGRGRTLVRGEAGWADTDGGATCELEAEVLSAFPLRYTVKFDEEGESDDEEESDEEEESDDEDVVLQHREESDGEASEAAQPPCVPAVQHIVERGGVTFRREAVDERDQRRRFAHAMLAKERAAASSEGVAAASEAAAEGGEGCELAADESGGAVAEGQHEGGSDNQQKKKAHPALTPTLILTPTPNHNPNPNLNPNPNSNPNPNPNPNPNLHMPSLLHRSPAPNTHAPCLSCLCRSHCTSARARTVAGTAPRVHSGYVRARLARLRATTTPAAGPTAHTFRASC